MKMIIMLFNTSDEYSAFYKRYTDKGITVSVVAGLELALSVNIADVGHYALDFFSNEECEKQEEDYLLQKRLHGRIFERRGQPPVTQVITIQSDDKGTPITLSITGGKIYNGPEHLQLVWIQDERYEAKPMITSQLTAIKSSRQTNYLTLRVEKAWLLSKDCAPIDCAPIAHLFLTKEGKYWINPFGGTPQEYDSTQVAFVSPKKLEGQ